MPKKRFGQHFLTDLRIVRRIVDFARLEPNETVVEVGPGTGILTRALAVRARRVLAIEIDDELIDRLRRELPPNVEVVERDALDVDFAAIVPEPYALVANLPYNIATPLLGRFVRGRSRISRVTVMVQKEVADRILSPPGSRAYGPLSVGIQYYALVRGGFLVPPKAFRPPPGVHSRVIQLEWKPGVADSPAFLDFVGRVFQSRRKKLINNLRVMYPSRSRGDLEGLLAACGLESGVRPEALAVSQFLELWQRLEPGNDGP